MTDIEKYAAVMKEIKLRTEVIGFFQSGQRDAHYAATTVETVGLQFRKIFELIVFASLAANRAQYAAVHSKFAKHWDAAELVKNLRQINPDFYPKPVVQAPTDQPGALHELKDRDQDYLTQDDLIKAHGRCGVLMHAANPFGKKIDYAFYQRNFPVWMTKIANLLDIHEVRLLGDPGFYVFLMQGKGPKGEGVSWTRFEPVKK